jgi:hypothetical protein
VTSPITKADLQQLKSDILLELRQHNSDTSLELKQYKSDTSLEIKQLEIRLLYFMFGQAAAIIGLTVALVKFL